jgi:hypothetical protein
MVSSDFHLHQTLAAGPLIRVLSERDRGIVGRWSAVVREIGKDGCLIAARNDQNGELDAAGSPFVSLLRMLSGEMPHLSQRG